VIANDGTRYSPAQKKGNDIVGSMSVKLQEQDIAAEFTSEDYDNLLAIANLNAASGNQGNPTMMGTIQVTDWFKVRVLLALVEKVEKMRWEALVDAQVKLEGDNIPAGTVVNYPNPAGHRVAAGGTWSDDTYDPLADIFAMMEFADSKGYTIGRLIAGNSVIFKLLNNAKIKAAVGGYVSVDNMGALQGAQGRVARAKLNEYLQENDLPAIEPYNRRYRTQTGHNHFLKRDVLFGAAITDRNVEIDLGDDEPLPMRNVMGYVGMGRPAGAPGPGRSTDIEMFTKKPPRVEAEGWQTSLPVNQDPESAFVITGIS
jgi:hypothetical protein